MITDLSIRDCRRVCLSCKELKHTKGGRMMGGRGRGFYCADCAHRAKPHIALTPIEQAVIDWHIAREALGKTKHLAKRLGITHRKVEAMIATYRRRMERQKEQRYVSHRENRVEGAEDSQGRGCR